MVRERALARFPMITPSNFGGALRLMTNRKAADGSQAAQNHYMLRLSYRADESFFCIERNNKFETIAVPVEQSEQLWRLYVERFNMLWSPKMAMAFSGSTFEVGDFIIRLGEVHLNSALPSQTVKSLVCNIETTVSVWPTNEQLVVTQVALSDLAESLGFSSSKSRMEAWQHGKGSCFEDVHLWCHALGQKI